MPDRVLPDAGSPGVTIAVEPLGKERVHDRDMYLVTIDRLGEWPEVRPRFDFFTTLIALDARELADAEILDVADQMIRAHCGYVSARGPDCERVGSEAQLTIKYGSIRSGT